MRLALAIGPVLRRTLVAGCVVHHYLASAPCSALAAQSPTGRGSITVTTSSAGPFRVTSPNAAVKWQANTTRAVTWNEAGTSGTPVSAANVRISLSTDGGLTFPTVILPSTPNDGSAAVILTNVATTTARVKIEAVDNVFFDVSNTNFS